MKNLIAFLLVMLSASSTYAQPKIALTGGLQSASVSPDFIAYPDTLRKTSSQKTGIVLGVVANIPITKRLSFHTGILYSGKGSESTQFYDTANLYVKTKDLPANQKTKPYSLNRKLNLQYIDVPLNLVYKLPLGKNSHFTIGAGPQVSIFYNGSTSFTTLSVTQDSASASSVRTYIDVKENNDLAVGKIPKKYRVLHLGTSAFLGVDFSRIFLHINYTKGLGAFYEEEDRKYKHQTLGLSLGVFLGRQNQ